MLEILICFITLVLICTLYVIIRELLEIYLTYKMEMERNYAINLDYVHCYYALEMNIYYRRRLHRQAYSHSGLQIDSSTSMHILGVI